MNNAIKLAIEKGGYQDRAAEAGFARNPQREAQIALDPLFWQALGKALEWRVNSESPETDQEWMFWALEYFKLVLTGGDAEKFWRNLLNPQPPE